MIIARKIAYNVAVSATAKIISTVLALISIGLITRYLGTGGFGEYATALAFLSFFSSLSDLGLYQVSTREISRPGADIQKIMENVVALRLIISLAIVFIAPMIIYFFPYPQEVKWAILVVAIAHLFSSGYQILNGVFQKNLAMDKVAAAELIGKFIQVLIIFIATKFNMGFFWIIVSLLFYMLATFFLVWWFSRRYIRIRLKFDFSYWRKFLKESYPLGISSIVVFIYFKTDTILLSIMKNSSDVGIYNAAYKVLENISFFPSMVVGLVFPIMSERIFSNWNGFRDIADKTLKIFVIITVPLVVGTMFLSEGIINLLGGVGFQEAAPVLRILIVALALIFYSNFLNAVLISANLQKKLMLILGVAAIFNVTFNLFFIPRYSYYAAAYTSLGTEALVTLLALFVALRNIKYIPEVGHIFSIIISGFFMGVYMYFMKNINFFALAFTSVFVYSFFIWAFKAVKTSEITSIISRKGIEEYGEIS